VMFLWCADGTVSTNSCTLLIAYTTAAAATTAATHIARAFSG
jgi:hypothetical protein